VTDHKDEKVSWPIGSMLGLGTFGPGSPGGRGFQTAALTALGVLVAGCLLIGPWIKEYPWLRWALGLLPGATIGYIAWRLWRYVGQLDELSRRLQLESMAITYLVGMGASLLLGGLAFVFDWNINPGYYILLDMFRAFALVKLARRYA
jgi:hypothetical protein